MRAATSDLSPQLLQEFFVTFARFEYALKNSGFVAKGQELQKRLLHVAKPDWNKFKRDVSAKFNKDSDPALSDACDYLLNNAPQTQVLWTENGTLVMGWETLPRGDENEAGYLLTLVKTVRNNLFHGGKFSDLSFTELTDRNTRLLKSSILILEKYVEIAPSEMRKTFRDAHL